MGEFWKSTVQISPESGVNENNMESSVTEVELFTRKDPGGLFQKRFIVLTKLHFYSSKYLFLYALSSTLEVTK